MKSPATLKRVTKARDGIENARFEYDEAVLAAVDDGWSATEVGTAGRVTEAAIRKTIERKTEDV